MATEQAHAHVNQFNSPEAQHRRTLERTSENSMPYALAFEPVLGETRFVSLTVEGMIPSWLIVSLLLNV